MTHKLALAAAFSAIFAAGLFAGVANAAEGDAPKPCVAKTFKIKKVEEACRTGGQPAAKKLMKKLVKKAKEAGETEGMKCNSCHNLKDYKVSDSANVAKIKKWL